MNPILIDLEDSPCWRSNWLTGRGRIAERGVSLAQGTTRFLWQLLNSLVVAAYSLPGSPSCCEWNGTKGPMPFALSLSRLEFLPISFSVLQAGLAFGKFLGAKVPLEFHLTWVSAVRAWDELLMSEGTSSSIEATRSSMVAISLLPWNLLHSSISWEAQCWLASFSPSLPPTTTSTFRFPPTIFSSFYITTFLSTSRPSPLHITNFFFLHHDLPLLIARSSSLDITTFLSLHHNLHLLT